MNKDELQANLSDTALSNILTWLKEPKYAGYKTELEKLIVNKEWRKLEDSFFKVIEFGTGGRRGTTGVGSNRINKVTIGESAQALCIYAASFDKTSPKKGIAIACDTRLSSKNLSQYVASVCAANGYKTYIFESFRSTPELSFAVRQLGCSAGIVISASHNPPADNGFKAYWSDGGQLVAPHDVGVMNVVESIKSIKTISYEKAVKSKQIINIGKEIDDKYIDAVLGQSEGTARDLSIVYSPLHGAGQTNVLTALIKAGFTKVSPVEAQMIPDGNFPTVENGKPNPEEKEANDLAVAQMMSIKADIAITNDPDADRIGVTVRQGEKVVYLNGNQSAVLATDYVLKKLKDKNQLTSKHYIAKTIVTTDLLDALANKYGVKCYGNMLIGFKYIGELIKNKETTNEIFVIGGEESYGLLKGDYARDKDGATGALPLAEYAAELKLAGKTLYDRLLEIFEEHGLYIERLDTVKCEGAQGFKQMQAIMGQLRKKPILQVGSHKVTAFYDYNNLSRIDTITGKKSPIDCIRGNVVALEFGDNRRRVTIRPSGTEPKLKLYVQWFSKVTGNVEDQYEDTKKFIEGISRELEGALLMTGNSS